MNKFMYLTQIFEVNYFRVEERAVQPITREPSNFHCKTIRDKLFFVCSGMWISTFQQCISKLSFRYTTKHPMSSQYTIKLTTIQAEKSKLPEDQQYLEAISLPDNSKLPSVLVQVLSLYQGIPWLGHGNVASLAEALAGHSWTDETDYLSLSQPKCVPSCGGYASHIHDGTWGSIPL